MAASNNHVDDLMEGAGAADGHRCAPDTLVGARWDPTTSNPSIPSGEWLTSTNACFSTQVNWHKNLGDRPEGLLGDSNGAIRVLCDTLTDCVIERSQEDDDEFPPDPTEGRASDICKFLPEPLGSVLSVALRKFGSYVTDIQMISGFGVDWGIQFTEFAGESALTYTVSSIWYTEAGGSSSDNEPLCPVTDPCVMLDVISDGHGPFQPALVGQRVLTITVPHYTVPVFLTSAPPTVTASKPSMVIGVLPPRASPQLMSDMCDLICTQAAHGPGLTTPMCISVSPCVRNAMKHKCAQRGCRLASIQ